MDILRNDLVPDADARSDGEASGWEKFLVDDGIELLAAYRQIGDPHLRRVVRRLVALVAEGQAREH